MGSPRVSRPLRFLEMALVAGADALVTGEGDLLPLVSDFPVPILTPNARKEHPDLSRTSL